ncbi:hypothetical protein AEYBE204_12845 [Asticcacaulis sp. YBE204]|nr:hypothetical protein AEYBE204_12845 [Asticcacaulis sp. YBE204]
MVGIKNTLWKTIEVRFGPGEDNIKKQIESAFSRFIPSYSKFLRDEKRQGRYRARKSALTEH